MGDDWRNYLYFHSNTVRAFLKFSLCFIVFVLCLFLNLLRIFRHFRKIPVVTVQHFLHLSSPPSLPGEWWEGKCSHCTCDIWQSGDNLWELVLLSHHVCPGDWLSICRLGRRPSHLLDHKSMWLSGSIESTRYLRQLKFYVEISIILSFISLRLYF